MVHFFKRCFKWRSRGGPCIIGRFPNLRNRARLALFLKRKQKYQNGNIHRKLKVPTSVILSWQRIQYQNLNFFLIINRKIHAQMWAETNHYFPPGQVETNSASHVFFDLLSKKSRSDRLERRVLWFCTICAKNQSLIYIFNEVMAILVPGWSLFTFRPPFF
jgi:hypothetical protein